jgi:hypothetical protein
MKEIKLSLHSIIDVITNSSTEIYTFTNSSAIEKSYELLNEILKIADSDKKAEDLFEIYIIPNDWDNIINYFNKYYEDEFEKCDNLQELKILLDEQDKIEEYKERSKFEKEKIIPFLKKDDNWKIIFNKIVDDGDNFYQRETSLIIVAKDELKSTENIINLFWNLFSQEASYNG